MHAGMGFTFLEATRMRDRISRILPARGFHWHRRAERSTASARVSSHPVNGNGSPHGGTDDVQIRDGMGQVHLSFDGALTLLQWLYEQKGELVRLVSGMEL